MNIKIEHIYHSGFTVETEDYYLIFDYYKGDISLKDKKTFVFVSHGHHDHYNEIIFDWEKGNANIDYIVSSDINLERLGKNIHIVNPYEELIIDRLKIKTFGSTDLGVSFLVSMGDLNIFHSGDLNWWHWESNSEEENDNEEKIFKDEIAKIITNKIDIAFVPVDPRLGVGYGLAGEYFIDKVGPKYFFPMHFGDKFSITKDFIHKINSKNTSVGEINHNNQVFNLIL